MSLLRTEPSSCVTWVLSEPRTLAVSRCSFTHWLLEENAAVGILGGGSEQCGSSFVSGALYPLEVHAGVQLRQLGTEPVWPLWDQSVGLFACIFLIGCEISFFNKE